MLLWYGARRSKLNQLRPLSDALLALPHRLNASSDIRRRLSGPGAHTNITGRASVLTGRGGAAGLQAPRVCQQAGSAECNECSGSQRSARLAYPEGQTVDHHEELRDQGRGSRRRNGLVSPQPSLLMCPRLMYCLARTQARQQLGTKVARLRAYLKMNITSHRRSPAIVINLFTTYGHVRMNLL